MPVLVPVPAPVPVPPPVPVPQIAPAPAPVPVPVPTPVPAPQIAPEPVPVPVIFDEEALMAEHFGEDVLMQEGAMCLVAVVLLGAGAVAMFFALSSFM